MYTCTRTYGAFVVYVSSTHSLHQSFIPSLFISLTLSLLQQYGAHSAQSPVPIPRSPPRSVRELLLRNNMGHYCDMLINNGYDDIRFIHETSEEELRDVGIASSLDREKACTHRIMRMCYGVVFMCVCSQCALVLLTGCTTNTVKLQFV